MKNNLVVTPNLSIGEWLQSARRSARNCGDQPGVENERTEAETALAAQVLLAHVTGTTRAWVLAHPEFVLGSNEQSHLDTLFLSLCSGTPLPYLTGKQEFFGLDFAVNPDVLIPRPETELLVERALTWVRENPKYRRAADVGTGSGCIAVSIAIHAPQLRWVAVDRSWKALQIARLNAARHNVLEQMHLVNADLLSACAGPFDLICANLPYIPRGTLRDLPVAKHEPPLALDGGEDGLLLIRALLGSARRWLAPGGVILLEMQFDQGEKIAQLVETWLPGAALAVQTDLGGLPRLVEIRYP